MTSRYSIFYFLRESALQVGSELSTLIARYYPASLYSAVPYHNTMGVRFPRATVTDMGMNSEPPEMEASRAGPDPAAERLAYSVDEAAHLTGLSRDLLYDQMRRGNLPYVKVGRRRLITRQHLRQFLGVLP